MNFVNQPQDEMTVFASWSRKITRNLIIGPQEKNHEIFQLIAGRKKVYIYSCGCEKISRNVSNGHTKRKKNENSFTGCIEKKPCGSNTETRCVAKCLKKKLTNSSFGRMKI